MNRWIDIDDDRNCYIGNDGEYERWNIDPDVLDEAKPTVESERKRGRWNELDGTTLCSACGLSLEDWIQAVFYKYCPNCGAKVVDR